MARTELVGADTASGQKRAAAKHKRLTLNQSYEVTQYLECQRERIDGKMRLPEVMAELAGKFPDWPLSDAAVRSTLRVRGITPKRAEHHMKGKSARRKVGRPGGDYYNLAREAKEAAERVGEFTHRLKSELDDLARAAGENNGKAEARVTRLEDQVVALTQAVQALQKELSVQTLKSFLPTPEAPRVRP